MNDRVLFLPYRGAPTTVSGIRSAALSAERDYAVRECSEEIVRNLAPKDSLSEIAAVENALRSLCRYTRDPRRVELVRSPSLLVREMMNGRRPCIDCDDGVALGCALLEAIGFQTQIVTVAFKHIFHEGQRQFTHVFSQALEPTTMSMVVVDFVPANVAQMLSRVKAAKIWPM